MRFGLNESVIARIHEVFRRFPEIQRAVIYGSRANGSFKTGSDIDLTLYGDELNADLLSTISITLDDLMLPYTFDLSIFDDLQHPELREHIERVGRTFYE
jgi:uncharacterized protein